MTRNALFEDAHMWLHAILRALAAVACGFSLSMTGAAAPVPDPAKRAIATPEEIDKAKKAVQQDLEALQAKSGSLQYLNAAALGELFPDQLFFSVLFRRYPVASLPGPPLKGSNVYVVAKATGKLRRLTEVKELEDFVREALPAIRDVNQAKNAVRAWLELAQVFAQDGYYKFSLIEEATKAEPDAGGIKASGKVIVMSGGNGAISVAMTFDKNGKLIRLEPASKLKPGPRPRCQATKLLDQDAIVRAMAEQDLLIMGRAARPYLDEQRAKAGPELKKAIDRIWQRILQED